MSSPEVVDLDDLAAHEAVRGPWLELAARLEGSSYFQTPDWVLSWWRTIGGRPPTRVAAWRSATGALEALVALSRDRERLDRRLPLTVPVYANAGSGAGAADHCGWLAPAERGEEVAGWVAEAVGRATLLVRSADPAWPARALPAGARAVEAIPCPRVALPVADGETGPSAAFVRQLRRFTRRLERDGVRFEWVAPGCVDEPLLQALFELHAARRAGGASTAFGLEQLPLHRLLAERAGARRGPAAVVARADGTVVGVLYGFWWRDTFAAYQSGWDPRYARDSIGSVLVLHALELAAGHGARTFDFLRGREPYKYRFGAQDRCDLTWLAPGGAAGALLGARQRIRRRRSTRRTGRPDAAPRRSG
jgi:CelD/BcsL family acetyltransferase involved in cellulose biosynthesis